MTARKQNRHPLERSVKFQVWLSWSRIVSGFAEWRCSESWSSVRPVMCGADAPRVSSGVSCWMVAVSFLAVFRTCPAGLVVGRVRRRMDRCDAFQQPVGLVEAGQGSGVVGAGVVRDDRGLAGAGFLLERVRCEGRLPGVLVLLGRVRRDCSAGRGGRRGRTGTSSAGPRTVWCVVLSGAACGGSRPRARGGPRLPCRPPSRRPAGP